MRALPSEPNPELDALLAEARRQYEVMTPAEREAMHRQQRDSWVRAEMGWPKDCPYR